jgi:hypothetical protein
MSASCVLNVHWNMASPAAVCSIYIDYRPVPHVSFVCGLLEKIDKLIDIIAAICPAR